LADRFIFGVAPIDYGPVLLHMPFESHLAVDTLPSDEFGFIGQRGFYTPLSDMTLLIRAPEGLQPS
jgi:hypothetical protein